MRILADENMDAEVVRWLRARGYDVLWAAENLCGTPDAIFLSRSLTEDRVILTHDLDFGELAIRHRLSSKGIILLRIASHGAGDLVARLEKIWPEIERQAIGRFTVVSESSVRSRILPDRS